MLHAVPRWHPHQVLRDPLLVRRLPEHHHRPYRLPLALNRPRVSVLLPMKRLKNLLFVYTPVLGYDLLYLYVPFPFHARGEEQKDIISAVRLSLVTTTGSTWSK